MKLLRQQRSTKNDALVLSTILAIASMQAAPLYAQTQASGAEPTSRRSAPAAAQTESTVRRSAPVATQTESTVRRSAPVTTQTESTVRRSAQAPTQSTSNPSSGKMLKGSIDYVVPQGTTIKLKMASVPTTGMHLFDRDLDGNLYPAELGQEVTCKTTEDMYIDDNKVIPEGTVFYGKVSHIAVPKRLHRDGSLSIAFDHLTTPDGRVFAFKADANNYVASTKKSKMREAGRVAAHAAGGAIVGALIAYQIFGTRGTIAAHGYNIAGGAAGGALLATGFALMDKGKKAVLEPGDNLNMQIDTDLLMPAAVEPVAKAGSQNYEGLSIEVEKSKVIKDGLDGYLVRLDVVVTNDSDKIFNSIDLYMEDGNGNRSPLTNGTDLDLESTEYLFSLKPHTRKKMRMNFQSEFPKLQRQLVWLDHKSRQVCFRQKLPTN